MSMNYDPNLTMCGSRAVQTVQLTFGQWAYRTTKAVDVGGNCTGLTVIETAVENVYEDLSEGRQGLPCIVLTDSEGNTLECEDEEDKGDDWLKDMLIGAEIVAIVPKATQP